MQVAKIISSQIAKVKIYVLYAGKNRNNTHFSKEMIEDKLIPSMYGMPIIGEFKRDNNDFGTHGGKTVITDEGATYETTTVAYGFIPESSQMCWETVRELNGTYKEYLVCEGYVWHKRFPELEVMLEQPNNQSMEIEIKDGMWNENDRSYEITDAELTGLCILGKDVEPCFESAQIGRFALEKIKYDLAEMVEELKELVKDEVKDMGLDNKKFDNEGTSTKENVPNETTETNGDEKNETNPTECGESNPEGTTESTNETTEPTNEASVGSEQSTEESFTKEDFESLKQELEELRAFKVKQERKVKEELVSKFENELTEEELQPVKMQIDTLTEEQIETQCFAILGKKKANFAKEGNRTQFSGVVPIPENFAKEDSQMPAWARAIQKYNSKKR